MGKKFILNNRNGVKVWLEQTGENEPFYKVCADEQYIFEGSTVSSEALPDDSEEYDEILKYPDGERKKVKLYSFDPFGGPYLSVGGHIWGKEGPLIKRIFSKNNETFVELQEPLEDNKIYNIDCVEGLKLIDDKTIDLVVTSPPYDDLRTYNGYCFDFENTAKELYRVMKDGGTVVWLVGDSVKDGCESLTPFKQAIYFKEIGFKVADTMILDNGSFAFPSKNTYHQVFSYMFILTKGKPKALNFLKDRKNLYVGTRGASGRKKDGTRNTGKSTVKEEYGKRFNIWRYPIGGGHNSEDKIAYKHPAIANENMVRDHILSWSNEGDIVLDPFMGSGTTAKMALLTGRRYLGFEISKEYCELAEERLKKYEKGQEEKLEFKG